VRSEHDDERSLTVIDTIRNWFTPTPTEPLAPEDRRALVEQRAATAAERHQGRPTPGGG
jgi:hypothetical protein